MTHTLLIVLLIERCLSITANVIQAGALFVRGRNAAAHVIACLLNLAVLVAIAIAL